MILISVYIYIDVFWFTARMCVRPPEPMNGYVNYTGLFLGSTATYSCKCGYKLIGSKVRHCQGNGIWSGNGTICVGKSRGSRSDVFIKRLSELVQT